MAKRKSDGDLGRLDGFLLNVRPDEADFRDYPYEPALVRLEAEIAPPTGLRILDQKGGAACTGFALAAVINLQLAERGEKRTVSARMLYEMARKFDEWEGDEDVGSSCRGAVKGWHGMGVCSEELAPYVEDEADWTLDVLRAKDARQTTLGAYYRVNRRIADFHAALNEVGALLVSASVHDGWEKSEIEDGVIPYRPGARGGHALAIVGYDGDGFWVQNSWGEDWGKGGLALWTYEDWLANIRDAWVLRLAVRTPQIWHLTPPASGRAQTAEGLGKPSPKRAEIVGHFVHIDDGDFDDRGRYWTDLITVEQTAELVAESDKYDHLLLYAHGGLNSIKASARRIVAMKETFKANGVYPFHFMYDTGLREEIKDVIQGKERQATERARGLADLTDRLIERLTRPAGRAIWREMKNGASRPFEPQRAGSETIAAFLEAIAVEGVRPKKLHLAGHSTGAILLANLLEALGRLDDPPRIETCVLMAPACTHDLFNRVYRPLVKAGAKEFGISRMVIYNLSKGREKGDTVTPLYRKSLLYLVSNAFEEDRGERLLGMQKFRRFLGTLPDGLRIEEADEESTRTRSRSHGGFDNDPATMNDLLKSILRHVPEHEFTEKSLRY